MTSLLESKSAAPLAVGFAIGALTAAVVSRLTRPTASADSKPVAEAPKASRQIYETDASVRQYIQFHFIDSAKQFAAYSAICDVKAAYDFPARLAHVALKHQTKGRALDIGCAVGRTTFELVRSFDECIGIDLSVAFISAAQTIRDVGFIEFKGMGEGERTLLMRAERPTGIDHTRAKFAVGDAQAIDPALGTFDCVIAANLLCRIPNPRAFLQSFQTLVNKGGVVVLASPYSWWAGATNPDSWIGGTDAAGPSADRVAEVMKALGFTLLEDAPFPFLIADHPRRFQLGFSHLTVWRKN